MKSNKRLASRWRTLPLAVRWLIALLMGLWGIYLVAGNVFLRPAYGPEWVKSFDKNDEW